MQTGDTCLSVAAAAGIPLNTLLANNPNVNTNCTNVYPGEVNKMRFIKAIPDERFLGSLHCEPDLCKLNQVRYHKSISYIEIYIFNRCVLRTDRYVPSSLGQFQPASLKASSTRADIDQLPRVALRVIR